jgi:hypothetical protein
MRGFQGRARGWCGIPWRFADQPVVGLFPAIYKNWGIDSAAIAGLRLSMAPGNYPSEGPDVVFYDLMSERICTKN